MDNIKQLVSQFREAIDTIRNAGEFDDDFSFYRFPYGCCGDTCYLLAQYLLMNNIASYYVCGMYNHSSLQGSQSHAWLMIEDGIIIDITGDQFRNNPVFMNYNKAVYVGAEDDFHKLFTVNSRDVYKNNGIDSLGESCQPRLKRLYGKINKALIQGDNLQYYI